MICLIALIVFAILGIFSASYRSLAKEAFECVFLKMTFRPCKSRLDKRLKAELSGKIMRKMPRLGKMVYKYFEIISWIFTILMIASFGYTVYAGYNYYEYGNCNGPESGGFCVFDAVAPDKYSGITNTEKTTVFPSAGSDPYLGKENAPVLMIEFGCYKCQYTKKAQPIVTELLKEYPDSVKFVYRDFPLVTKHPQATKYSEAAHCANDQGKYWEYHDALFDQQDYFNSLNESDPNQTIEKLVLLSKQLGMDSVQFSSCLVSEKYKDVVMQDYTDGYDAGIYGTPTFFINNHTIVGPQPIKAFQAIIGNELSNTEHSPPKPLGNQAASATDVQTCSTAH